MKDNNKCILFCSLNSIYNATKGFLHQKLNILQLITVGFLSDQTEQADFATVQIKRAICK